MNEERLRERIAALKAENADLRERLEKMRRQLGGTNGALTRAHARIRRLEDELAAARMGK